MTKTKGLHAIQKYMQLYLIMRQTSTALEFFEIRNWVSGYPIQYPGFKIPENVSTGPECHFCVVFMLSFLLLLYLHAVTLNIRIFAFVLIV